MLFMLIVKSTNSSEEGKQPSKALVDAMSKYNQDLVNAGVRVMAKGLRPSAEGMRITFSMPGEEPIITNGPFDSEINLVIGFILIEVNSKEEAVSWALRMPDPLGHGEGQIELRQVN